MEAYKAAYGVCPSTNSSGPQCSASHDFCFFCAFEADPDSIGSECDLYGSMTELVTSLGSQDKEIPTIVNIVHRNYCATVQPHLEWTNPSTGVTLQQPTWTKDSIRRHLLHSNQFSGLFSSVIRNMFHSILMKCNETMIDRETGMLVDEHRKAFLETTEHYRRWMQTMEPHKIQSKK